MVRSWPMIRQRRRRVSRQRISRCILRRCWAVGPARRRSHSASTQDFGVTSSLLLLEGRGSRLDQGVLNATRDVGGEDGSSVQGARHGLLPGLQHFIQFPAGLRVDQSVCVHEGLIHVLTQEAGVGRAYVLDNGVDYIQRRQLLRRRGLGGTGLETTTHGRRADDLLCGCDSPGRARWPWHVPCFPWR